MWLADGAAAATKASNLLKFREARFDLLGDHDSGHTLAHYGCS